MTIETKNALPISSSVAGNRSSIACDDALAVRGRVAEVAGQHLSEPAQVLHRERLVEPEVVLEALDVGRA